MKQFAPIFWLVIASTLHSIPWLVEESALCGLLAIATGLFLVTRTNYLGSFWFTLIWTTISIASAFHWSPAAMAYTLSSEFGLGLLVAAPLILWDGLRMTLCYWLAARLTRDVRTIWFAAAITTLSVEQFMPTVFPWRMGFMVLPWPWLIQAVDVFGSAWTTFIAFASAGLLISVISWLITHFAAKSESESRPKPTRIQWVTLPIVSLSLIYGVWVMGQWSDAIEKAPKVRVALVQVDPSYVVSLSQLRELTASAASDVDIVCWPESSGGNYELSLDELSDERHVFECSREPERGLRPWPSPTCELILGGKNYIGDPENPDSIYVCAMLIDEKERITARYNKRYLMPFGEYVPCEEIVPGLAELFDMAEHITPGINAEVLKSQTGAQLGTMLCYEDMVPDASRMMVAGGANVLLSLINGSAFESKFTLSQHRLLAQLRAIECRRYFLRCAATGETCVISPLGNITTRLPLQENGVLKADVALLNGATIFSQFPWMGSAFCIIGLAIQIARVGFTRKR